MTLPAAFVLGATGGLSARVVALEGAIAIHTGRQAASGTRLKCHAPSGVSWSLFWLTREAKTAIIRA